MMPKMVDQTEYCHLCYLIVNDLSKEKYNGMSHVAEHALLIPSDTTTKFAGQGYTCNNHIYLHFCCEALETLKEIDKRVMTGEILTDENVFCAKQQVTEEISDLRQRTQRNERIVRFVTDNRIDRLSMGEANQITKIETADIQTWFSKQKDSGNIHRYMFFDAHEMILSTPLPHTEILDFHQRARCMDRVNGSSILYLPPMAKTKTVQLYFSNSRVTCKGGIGKKALYEHCVQREIYDDLGFEVVVTDKFFDIHERFVALSFLWDTSINLRNILTQIRQAISSISSEKFLKYKKNFKQLMLTVMKQEESNSEILNAMKNEILYHIPRIQLEDLKVIDSVSFESFPREQIAGMPLKIIVR